MNTERLTIVVLMMLAFPAMAAKAEQAESRPALVAVYLVHDPKITAEQAAQKQLSNLLLCDKPVLTSEDVLFYDHEKCRFYLTSDVAKGVVDAVGAAYGNSRTGPGWMKWTISTPTVPVVVVVGDKRQFLAALHGDDSLFRTSWPVESPTTQPAPKRRPESNWSESLPKRVVTLSLLIPWGKADDTDPRDGRAFLGALKGAGNLDPRVLAKPRMTAQEATAVARMANVNYRTGDAKTAPQPVPEDWKPREVAFCQDVHVTIPSTNIIGLDWGPPLHCIWVVHFAPAEATSELPAQKNQTPKQKFAEARRIRGEWFLVDDTMGQTLRIYRPLYAKSLPVKGADQLMIGPIATQEEVRKKASEHLSQVDETVFLESVEILPLTDRDLKFRFWTPQHGVWLCKGKDSSGTRRALLLRDGVPYYRGPEVLYKSEFEMRRAIPAKQ